MLSLTLAGRPIPIPSDFEMELTWKNPACDFEKIPSGYGLGLSFPINEYTRALFGNPERFSKYRESKDQKIAGFEVRFSGVLLMSGSLLITSASGGNYKASLVDEIGILGENEQERDILEFDEFNNEVAWTNSTNFNPDTHVYCCFPIINTAFFKEKGFIKKILVYENGPGYTNRATGEYYDQEVLSYCFAKSPVLNRVNALHTDNSIKQISDTINLAGNEFASKTITVISPFFFLNKIITNAIKSVGFYIDNNILNTSEIFKMLCIYNNFDITINSYDVSNLDPIEYAPIAGEYYPPGYDEELHKSAGSIILQYIRSYPETIRIKDYLPKMKLGDLLLSTQNLINVCFHPLPDHRVNIYSREAIITGSAIDLNKYFLGTWEIGEKKCVALNFTHETDKLDLVFAERFHDISERIADIKEPVANWAALLAITDPIEGDIRWMTSANCFYEYRIVTQTTTNQTTLVEKTVDVLGWDEFSIGIQNGWYKYGRKDVETIKSSWSTCFGDSSNTLVNQQGNMNAWKAKIQAFAPRLLVYAGNNQGGNETANFSLEYEKAGKGILPTCWKNWNPFWANRLAVTGSFDLPLNVLRHVIYNICSKYRTREGEFIIEKMSCKIRVTHIGDTTINGFKVE